MSDGTPRTFCASLRGAGASQMTLGGIDLLRSGLIKGVDIYLEAGQSPQVVIRPIVDQMMLDLTAGDLDGKAPRYKVAPDVAFLLEELGWVSPETVETSQYAMANLKRELQEARERVTTLEKATQDLEGELDRAVAASMELQERITAQETELETAAQAVEAALNEKAQMAEELASAHGQLDDLKLANTTLHQELESAQAEIAGASVSVRLRDPYDPAA